MASALSDVGIATENNSRCPKVLSPDSVKPADSGSGEVSEPLPIPVAGAIAPAR